MLQEALDPGSAQFFLVHSSPSPLSPALRIWGPDSALVSLAKWMTMASKGPPTDTSGERSVPGPALPAQTQQLLAAPQAVPRVTAEGHRAPCKLASIVNLVAKLGGSRVLTFDEFKTWQREKRRVSKTGRGRNYSPLEPTSSREPAARVSSSEGRAAGVTLLCSGEGVLWSIHSPDAICK